MAHDIVFHGRLRYRDPAGAEAAASRLAELPVFAEGVGIDGPVLVFDVTAHVDASAYPDAIDCLDDVAELAIGGSVNGRLGGQPPDWIGAGAPLPGLEEASAHGLELVRGVLGGELDAVEAGRAQVAADPALLREVLRARPLVDDPQQLALLVMLVGDSREPDVEPVMREALELQPGTDARDIARHLAVARLTRVQRLPFDWTDRDAVALAVERLKAR